MCNSRLMRWPMLGLLGVLALVALAGCGGGTTTPFTPTSNDLKNPVENPSLPGSIGGTVYTLANYTVNGTDKIVIDTANLAAVTLIAIDGSGNDVPSWTPRTTTSNTNGGYQFADVPKGVYRLEATVNGHADPSVQLSGSIPNVEVKGGLPTLMANLLLGDATKTLTFTGTVRQNGQIVSANSDTWVTIAIDAPLFSQLTSSGSVILAAKVGGDGTYSFTVPDGGTQYILTAHSATSQLTPLDSGTVFTPPIVSPKQVDLVLTNAVNPTVFPYIMDVIASTLPEPTPAASMEAAITRVAVAQLGGASDARIAQLKKLGTTRSQAQTRAASLPGSVENDLIWFTNADTSADDFTLGYRVYRAASNKGPYTLIGTNNDQWLNVFADNDPALQIATPVWYTMTSFAAGTVASKPAQPVQSKPLPVINVTGPSDGAVISGGSAKLMWDLVPGAKGYIVIVYDNNPPTFNAVSDTNQNTDGMGANVDHAYITHPGTYWWSVSAYDIANPTFSTAYNESHAVSYSAYHKVVITQ